LKDYHRAAGSGYRVDMRHRRFLTGGGAGLNSFLVIACVLGGLSASEAPERNHLTLSFSPVGLGIGITRQTGRQWVAGLEGGLGSDCLFSEGVASSHAFAQPFFGGDTGREWPEEHGFHELGHINLFYRYAPRGRWQVEFGFRASSWWNLRTNDPSPDFLSGYVVPAVRWRRVRCGPRLMVGRFSCVREHDGKASREHALAIAVAPLTVHLDFTKAW
jgi:hypothetical protein